MQRILSEMDINQDGVVTLAEFTAWYLRWASTHCYLILTTNCSLLTTPPPGTSGKGDLVVVSKVIVT